MLKNILSLTVFMSGVILALEFTSYAETTTSNKQTQTSGTSPKPKRMKQQHKRCNPIKERIRQLIGPGHVDCYINLFMMETGCRTNLIQPKGTAGNPAQGFGICSLETSAAKRRPRGRNCRNASTTNIDAQILCCRDIMVSFSIKGSYFGPVRRRETPKCN